MKTLNILSDSELKQIFGPLEDILPLHEGNVLSNDEVDAFVLNRHVYIHTKKGKRKRVII
jgi:hypothetical protein